MPQKFISALAAVLTVFLLAGCDQNRPAPTSTNSHPLETDKGHLGGTSDEAGGGGFIESYFMAASQEILDHFKRYKILDDKHEALEELISRGQLTVKVSQEELLHSKKGKVDALNYPSKNTIVLYEPGWKKLVEQKMDIRLLTCHELAGVIGVDDDKYQFCSKYFPLHGISPSSDANQVYCLIETLSLTLDKATQTINRDLKYHELYIELKKQELSDSESAFQGISDQLKTKEGQIKTVLNESLSLQIAAELNTPKSAGSKLSVYFQLMENENPIPLAVDSSSHSENGYARFQYLNPTLVAFFQNELGIADIKPNATALVMYLMSSRLDRDKTIDLLIRRGLDNALVHTGAHCQAINK